MTLEHGGGLSTYSTRLYPSIYKQPREEACLGPTDHPTDQPTIQQANQPTNQPTDALANAPL
jgi:hypothetical protein